jgi:formate hydrogenlyase subunit 6/NADH:ubiquinone oxidoreductase subunit I
MPQPRVVLDYSRCNPELCENGVCAASLICERKVLRQDAPGDMPELYPSRCLGCVDCLPACPTRALQLMK